MTKKLHQQTLTIELGRKTDEHDQNNKNNYYIYGQVQRLMFVGVNFCFWSYSFGHLESTAFFPLIKLRVLKHILTNNEVFNGF